MTIKTLFAGLMIVSVSASVLSGAGEAWPGTFSSPHQISSAGEIIFPAF